MAVVPEACGLLDKPRLDDAIAPSPSVQPAFCDERRAQLRLPPPDGACYRLGVPSSQEILAALRAVPYPGFTRDIVSFGMIKNIDVGVHGVTVSIAPTTSNQEVIRRICQDIESAVTAMKAGPVTLRVDRPPRAQGARPAGPAPIPGVRYVVAVASGKGGVGKSTIATNLAVALGGLLDGVGLLDADVYGPSIPVMLGIRERPTATADKRIVPVTAHGLKVISMGLLLGEDAPVIWRGPMLTKLLGEFVYNVEWGKLDCLVLDLPPGTGDVQLTLTQQVKLCGGVIVTTPQDIALLDVKRGMTMFQEANVPVLGVIENMSFHECAHCGHRAEIFGHGGGARMAERMGVPFLGEIPLRGAVRQSADEGQPIVTTDGEDPASRAIREIAARILTRIENSPAAAC